MKKLFFLVVFIFIIHGNLFSVSQFASEDPQLYIDFSAKNLDSTIRAIAGKFVNSRDFEKGYKRFKKKMMRDLKIDITDEKSLSSIGIDSSRRSGVVFTDIDFSSGPQFFIAVATNNAAKCRNFFFKFYKSKERETREKVLFYNNLPINILEKKRYTGKYKEDFATVALDGYLLISNKVDSIKKAIDNAQSKKNLLQTSQFQNAIRSIEDYKNSTLFFVISGSFIEKIQALVSGFTGQDISPELKGLYKLFFFAVNLNEKEILFDGYAIANKEHKLFPDLVKIYRPKSYSIDLFPYLPAEKPYLITRISLDTQLYLNRLLPSFIPQFQKEMDYELDKLTKEMNFDVKANIVKNLGNHYSLAVYDFSAKNLDPDSRDFLKDFDFLAYAEVVDETTLKKTITFLLDKAKKENMSRDFSVTQIDIDGKEFYSIGDSKFKLYFGTFMNHLLITTRENRLRTVVRNVKENESNFLRVLDDSVQNDFQAPITSNFYIDLEKIVSDQKIPAEILDAIKWNQLRYLHFYGGNKGAEFFSKMKLVFR